MVGVEPGGLAAERLSLRLLRTFVEELSEELKRGSLHSQCCDTIYSLSSSLAAAADDARRPLAADDAQHSWSPTSADKKVESNILDELRDDSPRGQQGLLSAFDELDATANAKKRCPPRPAEPKLEVSFSDDVQNDSPKGQRGRVSNALFSSIIKTSYVTRQSKSSKASCRVSSGSNQSHGMYNATSIHTYGSAPYGAAKSFSEVPSGGTDGINREALLRMFRELDQDCSGTLDAEELRAALVAVGIPKARTQKMLYAADTDGNGEIAYHEWKSAICNGQDLEIKALNDALKTMSIEERQKMLVRSHSNFKHEVVSRCMLRPDSYWRLIWDIFLALLCIYVALVLPFTTGFSPWIANLELAERLELAIDLFFLCDVCLNFRTGIFKGGSMILDSRRVAVSYLSSWFLLDLTASIPLSEMTSGSVASVRLLKLLKIPKLLKAVRVIRSMMLAESPLVVLISEYLSTRFVRGIGRRGTMLCLTVLICHWLACMMPFTSTDWVSEYLARNNQPERLWSVYIVALYWAITAITSVGWGDITPRNDAERVYVVVAMVVGGAYYGYAVGTLVAIVTNTDLNKSAYNDRLEAIYAWLDHHKLPAEVRRRVIRYFKLYLSAKAAINESDVVNDLSPALRNEVGTLIINGDVLHNPIFDKVPMSAVTRLQPILETIHLDEGNVVVRAGESGMAMFIISEGLVRQEFPCKDIATRILAEGYSFGEEILCSLSNRYCYTAIISTQYCCMFVINQDYFQSVFEHMPDVIEQVVKNAMALHHVVIES